jgi:hypothetical protein
MPQLISHVAFSQGLPIFSTSTDVQGDVKLSKPRHYGTSRKVAGSILDKVIAFFSWPNPSSRIMALGSTQSLTEMSNRNLPVG